MSKQFVPVPEYLTAMCVGEKELYDTVKNGEAVFFVFDTDTDMNNEKEPEYYTSMPGFGSGYEKEIFLVPTIHCKECHQRMHVNDIPLPEGNWNIPGIDNAISSTGINYTCNCGMHYNSVSGWRITERFFKEIFCKGGSNT